MLFFSGATKLIGKLLEKILAAHESEAHHSRAYITGDDELDFAVAYAIGIAPPLILDLLNLDIGAGARSQHQSQTHQHNQL